MRGPLAKPRTRGRARKYGVNGRASINAHQRYSFWMELYVIGKVVDANGTVAPDVYPPGGTGTATFYPTGQSVVSLYGYTRQTVCYLYIQVERCPMAATEYTWNPAVEATRAAEEEVRPWRRPRTAPFFVATKTCLTKTLGSGS